MDEQLRRIINFLKNNNNRNFEAADIAYHLKLDELYTDKTLALLQSRKMATSSISPDGKVVWHTGGNLNPSETFTALANTTSTRFDNLSQISDKNKGYVVEEATKRQTPWITICVAVIILVAAGGYLGKWYVDKKFTAAMDVAKAAVPMIDYAEFRGRCIQNNVNIQKKIDVLYSQLQNTKDQIDILKLKESSIQQQILDLKKAVRKNR
jgi:hypothetical protein